MLTEHDALYYFDIQQNTKSTDLRPSGGRAFFRKT